MALNREIYIIADLHLNSTHSETADIFKNFLNSISDSNNCLYILGDFFDYWIGDDHKDNFYHEITENLKQATAKGLEIKFMLGNRDFLIGKKFLEYTGITLIKDPYYIKIKDKNIALAHGDLMCTTDVSYQLYRRFIARNPIFQFIFRRIPLFLREKTAKNMRSHSYAKNRKKPNIDVTNKGVNKYRKNCEIVIHGHTHNMAIHFMDGYTRYVLGDWFKDGNYLKISTKGEISQVTSLA